MPRDTSESGNGRGILLTVLATIAYAVADTLSKFQDRDFPVLMIVWARYFVPFALVLVVYFPRRGRRLWRTAFPGVQLIRGLLLTAGTVSMIFAYRFIPLAEAQAIGFIHPVLLTLLAVAFLGEEVSTLGWVAVLLCFSGVLIIIRPGGGLFTPAALLPLGLALCYSTYQLFTRRIAGRESAVSSLFYVMAIGTLTMTASLPFVWVTPGAKAMFIFVLIGAMSGLGHFAMIKALEVAPASLVAPFGYVQLLWVGLLGWLVFGDVPGAMTLFGMGVVVAGGLLVLATRRRPPADANAKESPAKDEAQP